MKTSVKSGMLRMTSSELYPDCQQVCIALSKNSIDMKLPEAERDGMESPLGAGLCTHLLTFSRLSLRAM